MNRLEEARLEVERRLEESRREAETRLAEVRTAVETEVGGIVPKKRYVWMAMAVGAAGFALAMRRSRRRKKLRA
jgi:hypothetical protein